MRRRIVSGSAPDIRWPRGRSCPICRLVFWQPPEPSSAFLRWAPKLDKKRKTGWATKVMHRKIQQQKSKREQNEKQDEPRGTQWSQWYLQKEQCVIAIGNTGFPFFPFFPFFLIFTFSPSLAMAPICPFWVCTRRKGKVGNWWRTGERGTRALRDVCVDTSYMYIYWSFVVHTGLVMRTSLVRSPISCICTSYERIRI